ncbi:clumping factor B [Galleria mellonella]|uniref:Clumping factor B n=1 Tax=Galleria mellonella TaxID=7137 RepID=A0A6J3BXQ3_GALME|nr:clumping factor B [Galleria mellonella]
MVRSRSLCLFLVLSLIANAFSAPNDIHRWKRASVDNRRTPRDTLTSSDNSGANYKEFDPESEQKSYNPSRDLEPDDDNDDNDDDEDDSFEPMQPAATVGGSNIFSLLRLANALLPGLSSGDNPIFQNMLRELFIYNNPRYILRRQDIGDNEIEIDYEVDLKPPPPSPSFQRHEKDEENEDESSDSDEDDDDDNDSEVNDEAEVFSKEEKGDDNVSKSKHDSDSKENGSENDSDYDSDEPPGGDGQGGGILGLLAGLSGGEDGQSDLGSLLAAVSGIVANLSGDGIDLNSLIASGIGLFVGLLSEGEENPGAVIASYLLTSLDTITGGGAQNNGAFFGNFVSKLIKGTSAAGNPEASSEEDPNKMPMADSAGFFLSLIMSLLGDMSKTSSGGSS